MKLLLLGGNFSKKDEGTINNNSKVVVQNAANIFQWNMINGFREVLKNDFYIVSAPFINSFPKGYRKVIYKGFCENVNEKYVSFFNFFGIRNISRYNHLKKAIMNFAKIEDNDKYVIVYSPHVPLLKAAYYLKKYDKSIKIILLLPDLPEFVTLTKSRSLLYRLIKPYDIKKFYFYSLKFDKYIFLTKQMNEIVNKKNAPYTIVEGIVNDDKKEKDKLKWKYKDNKVVSYTGTLDEKYGIKNLVEAFMMIKNKDFRLIICGQGDCDNYINECKKIDSRIVFEGKVSADEAKYIQVNSDLLVNPRQNIEEFTKFSFPSKNLEYLSTGNPVIAYKLEGIPDEYDNIFIYPNNNSILELKNKICECLELPISELNVYKQKVFRFLEKKNIYNTTNKILDFIVNNGGDNYDNES